MKYGVYLSRVSVCLPFPKDQKRITADTKNSKSSKKEIWDAVPMVDEFFVDEFYRKRLSFQLQIKITNFIENLL